MSSVVRVVHLQRRGSVDPWTWARFELSGTVLTVSIVDNLHGECARFLLDARELEARHSGNRGLSLSYTIAGSPFEEHATVPPPRIAEVLRSFKDRRPKE